jgi:predicted esterase
MRYTAHLLGSLWMILRASSFVCVRTTNVRQLTCPLQMAAEAGSGGGTSTKKPLRVLALHGSEGTGLEFSVRLYPLREKLLQDNIDMQITAISAPFNKGHGYAWWTMEQGVRSFNAEEYIGFEESASIVLRYLSVLSPELVVGHSQGAILVAALIAQNRVPYHPANGYILNGVAWPNPYGQQLFNLKLDEHISPPRLLFVMGEDDTINPLSSAKQVRDRLDHSGYRVTTHTHSGGHSVPYDEESIRTMAEWTLQGEW